MGGEREERGELQATFWMRLESSYSVLKWFEGSRSSLRVMRERFKGEFDMTLLSLFHFSLDLVAQLHVQ